MLIFPFSSFPPWLADTLSKTRGYSSLSTLLRISEKINNPSIIASELGGQQLPHVPNPRAALCESGNHGGCLHLQMDGTTSDEGTMDELEIIE